MSPPTTTKHNHRFKQLMRTMRELSASTRWDDIRDEWMLDHIYEEWGGQCVCGHEPIVEHCVLRNKITGHVVEVGNVCVRHFLDRDYSILFQGIRRVEDDIENATNRAVLDYARQRGWITPWEYGFYTDTWRKRKLSEKQSSKRIQINERILRHYRAAREA